jgi:hypothetical protein
MKNWTWLRLGTLAAGVGLGAVAVAFPVVAAVAGPASAFLLGVAVKTPGHEPAMRPPDSLLPPPRR